MSWSRSERSIVWGLQRPTARHEIGEVNGGRSSTVTTSVPSSQDVPGVIQGGTPSGYAMVRSAWKWTPDGQSTELGGNGFHARTKMGLVTRAPCAQLG